VNYLLDTSALKWAYMSGYKHTRRCRYVIGRCKGRVFVAEITVLEIVNALASETRGGRLTVRQFWDSNMSFLADVGGGRLEVVRLPSSEYIACRDLLTLVGINSKRNLQTQDAMVAYTARRLALQKQTLIKVLTGDRKLARIINELPLFQKLVSAEYLNP
jgi:predicted nucleic acid-binding protein